MPDSPFDSIVGDRQCRSRVRHNAASSRSSWLKGRFRIKRSRNGTAKPAARSCPSEWGQSVEVARTEQGREGPGRLVSAERELRRVESLGVQSTGADGVAGPRRRRPSSTRVTARWNRSPCHGEEASTTSLGQKGQDRFDASTGADVRRIGVADRPHNGAERCLAEGTGICHSDDSVFHQSWRPTSVREPPARARTREAYSAAAAAVGGMSAHQNPESRPGLNGQCADTRVVA